MRKRKCWSVETKKNKGTKKRSGQPIGWSERFLRAGKNFSRIKNDWNKIFEIPQLAVCFSLVFRCIALYCSLNMTNFEYVLWKAFLKIFFEFPQIAVCLSLIFFCITLSRCCRTQILCIRIARSSERYRLLWTTNVAVGKKCLTTFLALRCRLFTRRDRVPHTPVLYWQNPKIECVLDHSMQTDCSPEQTSHILLGHLNMSDFEYVLQTTFF